MKLYELTADYQAVLTALQEPPAIEGEEADKINEDTLRGWPIATLTKMYDWVKENSPTLKTERTEETILKEMEKLQKELDKLNQLKLDADHPKA